MMYVGIFAWILTISCSGDVHNSVCDTEAVVGLCAGLGCWWDHGNAHCAGAECFCDDGHCSYDGWHCVPIPMNAKTVSNATTARRTRMASSTTRTLTATTTTATATITETTVTTTITPTSSTTTSSTSTATTSTSTITTTTTLAYYANAVVGSCLGVGCFWNHGNAHCGGWSRTQCICDDGYCTHDMWHCVPCPHINASSHLNPVGLASLSTTATTTSAGPTEAQCIPDAIVGCCFITGCFWHHGNAHCGGWGRTQCVCDEGYCSRDQWYCELCSLGVPDENMLLAQVPVLADNPISSQTCVNVVAMLGVAISAFVVLRRQVAPQQLTQPLLVVQ